MPQQMANPNQQVGMILYPVERGQDGQQYITTRAGYKVAVPGLGIAPDANQISVFTDPQNHFWYVDKNGNPTLVSAQQMQSVMSQIQGQAMQRGQAQYNQYPQTMPYQGMPPQNMYPAQTPTTTAAAAPAAHSNNNSGSSAMVTGLAAAGGAAMGSMITNSMYNNNNQYPNYNGMPYGQPIYKEPTGQYYYANQAGQHVPVTPTAATAPYFNQYSQQAATGYANQQQQQQTNKEAAAGHYANQQQQAPQGAPAAAAESQQKEGRFGRRGKEANTTGTAQQAVSGQKQGKFARRGLEGR